MDDLPADEKELIDRYFGEVLESYESAKQPPRQPTMTYQPGD
jgi:hypothetical protein